MGWKTNSVLIHPAALISGAGALLNDLGYADLSPLGEKTYETAIWPENGVIWAGEINGCVI